MSNDVLNTFSIRQTPQRQKADARQVKNNAGGYTFQVTPEEHLRRFLCLGTDGGTYYTSPRDLTVENAQAILAMINSGEDAHKRVTDVITEISVAGRAPKANPGIFALALAASHGSLEGKRYALDHVTQVCRTGTHLFTFARYIEQFRGWGPTLRKAVGGWYASKNADALAYQVVKYRQREGWAHRDLLRLSHPTSTPEINQIFDYITKGNLNASLPNVIEGYLKAQMADADYVSLIEAYPALSWEMLPDVALGDPKVWEALIHQGMPMTALIRQLGRLTNLNVLKDKAILKIVVEQITDTERLRKARIHPVNVLVAQRTYAQGHGARGSSSWTPVRQVVDALDKAFYQAFGNVEPSGKRLSLNLDVSGSMGSPIANMPLSCREASGALALVQMATETDADVFGFTSGSRVNDWLVKKAALTPLTISPRQRLDDAIRTISGLPFGGTDCALPMTEALKYKREYDTFVVYTDSETWYGSIHPYQALRQYREKMGIDAKLIVVGMTATRFTIADPSDAGMLDVVGFDSAVPNLINDFARGL